MGFKSFFGKLAHSIKRLITRTFFLWWLSVIITVDILLLLYYYTVQLGVYPPLALLIIEVLAFAPITALAIITGTGGKKHDRLRDKTQETADRKNYAGLESRTRF